MSKTNSHETQYLSHIFVNAAIANIGDGTGLPVAGTEGNFFLRLYTSAITVDDGTLGTEAAYTSYVQVTMPRNASDFNVSGNSVDNVQLIGFPKNTGSSETIRFWALWKTTGGSTDTDRLFWGQFTSDLVVGTNVTPEIAIGQWSITED